MNYTENYHLPQWVKSDRIMMEDFNAAMAEIESGLTENNSATEDLRQSSGAMDERFFSRLCRLHYNHYCSATSISPVPHQIGFFYQNASKDASNITGTMLINGVRFAGRNGTGLTIDALARSYQEITPLSVKKNNLSSAVPLTATFTPPATGNMRQLFLCGSYNNNDISMGETTTSFRITIKNLNTGSVEQIEDISYIWKHTNAAFSEYVHGPFYFLGGARYQITIQPLNAVCDVTASLIIGTDSRISPISNEGKVTATHTIQEQEDSLGGMVVLRCNINGAGGEMKLLWDGEERQPATIRTAHLGGGRIAQELIYLREDVIPANSTLSFRFDCAEGGDFQFFDWGAALF